MKTPENLALAVAAALSLDTAPAVRADQNGVLLKVLVRKGILTEQEAAAVKSEVSKEKAREARTAAKSAPDAAAPAPDGPWTKLDLRESVETLRLYGDLRLRYQYDDKD